MVREYRFDDPREFLERLGQLLDEGVPPSALNIRMPFYLPEVEDLLYRTRGRLRFFSLAGGLLGFGGGMALTVYTVISWPIMTGGKPLVSLPPFFLISYLLVILLGSLASFAGFLLLGRLPNSGAIRDGQEFDEDFRIVVEEEPPKEAAWKR